MINIHHVFFRDLETNELFFNFKILITHFFIKRSKTLLPKTHMLTRSRQSNFSSYQLKWEGSSSPCILTTTHAQVSLASSLVTEQPSHNNVNTVQSWIWNKDKVHSHTDIVAATALINKCRGFPSVRDKMCNKSSETKTIALSNQPIFYICQKVSTVVSWKHIQIDIVKVILPLGKVLQELASWKTGIVKHLGKDSHKILKSKMSFLHDNQWDQTFI